MKKNKSVAGRVYDLLQKVINAIVAILLALMVVIVFSNVIGRYFIGESISWSEELSRFMLIWLVFLGSILAYEKDEHLGMDILVKALPKKLAQIIIVLADALIIYAIWLIARGGYELASMNMGWMSSSVPGISYGSVYIVVPVTAVIMILQTLIKMYGHVKDIFTRGNLSAEEGIKC